MPRPASPISPLALLAPFLLALLLPAEPAQGQVRALPAPQADSSFGGAVALDAGRALVGASGENVCGTDSGAAYVFEKTGRGAWRQAARLVPSDCEAGAFFGRSLALSGDRAVVGASKEFFAEERPNVAYVFERNAQTGAWEETARLTVDPRRAEGTFAASVALDGTRALVTARGRLPASAREERASRAERPAARATPVQGASPPRSSSAPRRRRAPGAGGGAAYLFERHTQTGRWRRVARLAPQSPDPRRAFGGAGALDGDRVAVAASPYFSGHSGAVYLFERRGGGSGGGSEAGARWVQTARLEGFEDFSLPVALAGERLLVGESRAGGKHQGAAVLFERVAPGTWERRARLRPRTPYRDGAFGMAVSLSAPGGSRPGRALVTGYDEQLGLGFNIDRVVYVFAERGGRWRQRQILDVGDVSFGTALDHHGAEAIVGHASGRGPGAAYVIGLQ